MTQGCLDCFFLKELYLLMTKRKKCLKRNTKYVRIKQITFLYFLTSKSRIAASMTAKLKTLSSDVLLHMAELPV